MRLPLLAILAALLAPTVVWASDPPEARSAYVERRGLQEADRRCGLFTPGVRAALDAGVRQARGTLLRAGWSSRQVGDLESAVVASAAGRACDDPRTQSAAASARDAASNWINANRMSFPGWERSWSARRAPGADGWRLVQSSDAPTSAMFGVRDRNGEQRLVLVVPVLHDQRAPTFAQLVMRDPSRSGAAEVSLAQRVAYGLEAGIPAPGVSSFSSSTRAIEREGGGAQAVFSFPDAAFRNLLALDPRESVEIRVGMGPGVQQRILFEVGDVGAARVFLTAPSS